MQHSSATRVIAVIISVCLRLSVSEAANFTSTAGYTFSYPDEWTTSSKPDAPFAEIASASDIFRGQGMLSMNSAVVGVYPLSGDPKEFWSVTQSTSSLSNVTEVHAPGGELTQVDYEDKMADGLTYRHRDTFKKISGRWFDVSLTYHSGDPRASTYLDTLAGIAQSLAATDH